MRVRNTCSAPVPDAQPPARQELRRSYWLRRSFWLRYIFPLSLIRSGVVRRRLDLTGAPAGFQTAQQRTVVSSWGPSMKSDAWVDSRQGRSNILGAGGGYSETLPKCGDVKSDSDLLLAKPETYCCFFRRINERSIDRRQWRRREVTVMESQGWRIAGQDRGGCASFEGPESPPFNRRKEICMKPGESMGSALLTAPART